MPHEDMSFFGSQKLMQADEIYQIAQIFVKLGVRKIRLTGGEPLVRHDFETIITHLATLPIQIALTTNGYLLDKHLQTLQKAGVKSVNISLDTLNAEKFHQITQRNHFQKVWDNVQLCIQAGLHVKLNVVLMKYFNEDEILDFVQLTQNLPIHIRFIEFMPFDQNQWDSSKVINNQEVISLVQSQFECFKLQDGKHDTDKKFGITGHLGTIAFISTLSDAFCATCNRMRLTADGKMKNCLFGNEEFDILGPLRNQEDIAEIIKKSIQAKFLKFGGQFEDYLQIQPDSIANRSMIKIGG